MHQIQASNSTMPSTELLALINAARAEAGEPELRRNKFAEKIEDELEGEHYTKRVVQNLNGTESAIYDLTRDQCALVSMRESKAVRRQVLAKLNAMAAVAHSEQAGYSPSLVMQFAQLALDNLPNLGDNARQCLLSKASEIAFGQALIPLPTVTEHLMSATEVGDKLGISANMVGRLAKAHNLKTAEYGEFRLDKSRHSSKQVESFVYNAAAVERLRQILADKQAA